MNLELQNTAMEVVIDFLRSHPIPGTPFWTIREISKKYQVTEYAAYGIMRFLTHQGYFEQNPHHRPVLKRHAATRIVGSSDQIRPAFIWPHWKRDDAKNFAHDFSVEMGKLCESSKIPFLSIEAPQAWGDPWITLQLKAFGSNVVMTMDSPQNALILFTKLRAEAIPMLSFGIPREGYDELNIPTVGGKDQEALHLLMLKLRSFGVRTPHMVGYGQIGFLPQERLIGIQKAYSDAGLGNTSDLRLKYDSTYKELCWVKDLLKSAEAPDALIFNDSPSLELALEIIPDLADGARQKKFYIAVFDDSGLEVRLRSTLPVISIVMPARLSAKKVFKLLHALYKGDAISKRTLIQRDICWPEYL